MQMTDDRNNPIPPAAQARDRTDLAFAALIALGLAAVVFATVILPAEFGRDPTGFGRLTGINALSNEGHQIDHGDRSVSRIEAGPPRHDVFTFELAGLAEAEYKLHLLANQSLLYNWTATGVVDFDFHGDPDRPSRPGEFSSYDAAQGLTRSGSFQAPFDGRHGWYFRNVYSQPVTITVETWGYYEPIGLLS